jgi:hypothetical protein
MSTQTYVNGVTLTDAGEFNAFDSVAYSYLTSVAGTNTITATGPANMTLAAPQRPVVLVPAVTNTGATTLNITPSGGAALTAKNVFLGGAALSGGELVAGVPVMVVYDGTQFNLLGITAWAQGSYTGTATGLTVGVTATVKYTVVGNAVTLAIPVFSGTSNATTFSISGGPAAVRTASGVVAEFIARCVDNGGAAHACIASMDSTGEITVSNSLDAATAFTSSGTKQLQSCSVTYTKA